MASGPQLVMIGDSITFESFNGQGTGSRLTEAYAGKLDVINLGHSGFQTSWTLNVLPNELDPTKQTPVKLLTLWLGANDSCGPGTYQYVSLTEYAENMGKILDLVHERCGDDIKIIVVTPSAIDEERLNKTDQSLPEANRFRRLLSNTKLYAEAAKQVAAERELISLDLFSEMVNLDSDYTKLLRDGLHFNSDGYNLVTRLLMDKIREKTPQLLPENLPSRQTSDETSAADSNPKPHAAFGILKQVGNGFL